MSIMDSAYQRVFHDVYRGFVKDIEDPENLGRCRVWVPAVHGALNFDVNILPWARPLVTGVISKDRCTYNLPDKDDLVWVIFEGGDKKYPIYLGGSYAKDENNLDPDKVVLYRENEDQIEYDRKKRIYDIKIGDIYIRVSPDLIYLNGNTEINGNLIVQGDAVISGHLTVGSVSCLGTCNKECKCL